MGEGIDLRNIREVNLRQSLFEIWGREQDVIGGMQPHFLTNTFFNNVVLVRDAPKPYVIKVPKNTAEAERFSRHEAEVHVQLTLASFEQPPPLRVAENIWWNQEPAYISLEYMPGRTVSEALAACAEPASRIQQEQCGQRIGSFVAWMAEQFPAGGERYENAPETPVRAGFQTVLNKADQLQAIGMHSTAKVIRELTDLSNDQQEELWSTPIIGHRDLHHNNILVDDNDPTLTPTAIIDFGNTGPSHPAYEFRTLPYLGPYTAPAAIDAYQAATGHTIDNVAVSYWAAGNCLSGLYYQLRRGQPVDTLKSVFETLLPSHDWTELVSED